MEGAPQDTIQSPQSLLEDFDSPYEQRTQPKSMPVLIAMFPQLGYFLAGGAAGMVSRTTTAPLDRLKVYLIAQTGTNNDTFRLAKSGAPLKALRGAMRSTAAACSELWAAGGIRSLFAGEHLSVHATFILLIIKGNGLNVIKVMPESAIKFGTFEVSSVCIATAVATSNDVFRHSKNWQFLLG
jgi:solute carrier family 25 phosphate transporter 23/24/25/41